VAFFATARDVHGDPDFAGGRTDHLPN